MTLIIMRVLSQLCILSFLFAPSFASSTTIGFYDSIYEGNYLKVLLELWSDPDLIDFEDLTRHQTPLHVAAEYGQTDITTLLLNHQANKSSADLFMQTPLHEACGAGHIGVVRALLAKPMNTAVRNILGYIPLHLASIWGQVEVVSMLLQYEKDTVQNGLIGVFQLPMHRDPLTGALEAPSTFSSLEVPDADHHTALHLAVLYDEVPAIHTLLQAGANITAADAVKWTPLHLAAIKGHVGAMKVLLNHVVYQHMTPMEHYAYIYNVVNAKNAYHATPLHTACMHGQFSAALLLVSYGADGNALDVDGLTPLAFVSNSDDADILLQAIKVQRHSKLTFQLQDALHVEPEVDSNDRSGNSNTGRVSPVYMHYHQQWQDTVHQMRENSNLDRDEHANSERLYEEYYQGGKWHPAKEGAVGGSHQGCDDLRTRYDSMSDELQKLKFDFLSYQNAAEKILRQLSEKHDREMSLLQSLLAADGQLSGDAAAASNTDTADTDTADTSGNGMEDSNITTDLDPYLSKWIFDLRLTSNSNAGNLTGMGGSRGSAGKYEEYFSSLGFHNMDDVVSSLRPLHGSRPELISAIFHELNSNDQRKIMSAISNLGDVIIGEKVNTDGSGGKTTSSSTSTSWTLW